MKIKHCITIVILILLAGCSYNTEEETISAAIVTKTLPSPEVITTSVPDAETTAKSFLYAWKQRDYHEMYSALTLSAKQAITEEQFIQQYTNLSNEVALSELDYEIINSETSTVNSQIEYTINLHSAIIGDIIRDYSMNLVMEEGQWSIQWDNTLTLPELANGNYLKMDYDIPTRLAIYDRDGEPLAIQTDATAIGLYPDYVDLEEDFGIVTLLARVTGKQAGVIKEMIEEALPGAYLPIGEVASDEDPARLNILSSYGAIVTSSYNSRFYPDGGVGPHIAGYVSSIQEDEIDEYRSQGYQGSERVGREGIERWGNSILGGSNGGALFVFDSDGKPIIDMGSAVSQPGQDIYTTIDYGLQKAAQEAIAGFRRGAVVVIERDTGRLLAMASSPTFNPNAYEFENINWSNLISEITNNPDNPQFNRAAQGQYPLGSVFKVITMAAALESGVYTPDTLYECGYVFDELFGFPRYDWTYERFQNDGVTRPSGTLTLVRGLIRSCNPYFWHIGLDLYKRGLTTAISDMARGFGLGSVTGIEVIEEESGQVPDPQSEVDAINLAIGQGDLQVTPLQVANFMAAIGNGGTLFRPQVVEKIVTQDGNNTFEYEKEVIGELPVSQVNLEAIQEGMVGVVSSEIPPGTAFRAFAGLEYPVAGKTGTATSGSGEPHSWFAGYTFADQENEPDIAIAVIIENIGDGSEYAAPVFRRIVETYFYGAPQKLYRWESQFNVTRTPTPIVTDTPTPKP